MRVQEEDEVRRIILADYVPMSLIAAIVTFCVVADCSCPFGAISATEPALDVLVDFIDTSPDQVGPILRHLDALQAEFEVQFLEMRLRGGSALTSTLHDGHNFVLSIDQVRKGEWVRNADGCQVWLRYVVEKPETKTARLIRSYGRHRTLSSQDGGEEAFPLGSVTNSVSLNDWGILDGAVWVVRVGDVDVLVVRFHGDCT
jgi:hypothetical protein